MERGLHFQHFSKLRKIMKITVLAQCESQMSMDTRDRGSTPFPVNETLCFIPTKWTVLDEILQLFSQTFFEAIAHENARELVAPRSLQEG